MTAVGIYFQLRVAKGENNKTVFKEGQMNSLIHFAS